MLCQNDLPYSGTRILHPSFSQAPTGAGGYSATLMGPGLGDNSLLTNGFESCSPGQLLFEWQSNGVSTVTHDIWIDIVDPKFELSFLPNTNFNNVQTSGPIQFIGEAVLTDPNGVNVSAPLLVNPIVRRFQFRVNSTPGDFCSTVVFNYNILGNINGADPLRHTNSRLFVCEAGANCDVGSAEQVWDWVTSGINPSIDPPAAFSVSNVTTINGGTFNSAFQPQVALILGDVTYTDVNWLSPSGRTFYMAPGASLSFGDATTPPQNLIVTDSKFLPCADQSFQGLTVGPNARVTFNSSANNNTFENHIYGANIGITVQPGGALITQGLVINGCGIGVTVQDAVELTMTNTSITYDDIIPPGSRYKITANSGLLGLSINGGQGSGANLVHQVSGLNVRSQIFGVTMSSAGGFDNQPQRPAWVNLNNSLITDVEDGVSCFNPNGFLLASGNTISAEEAGIQIGNSPGMFSLINWNNVRAQLRGIDLSGSPQNTTLVSNNTIQGTGLSGVRGFRSPGSFISVRGNTVTTSNTSENTIGIGIFGNSSANTSINGNDVTVLAQEGVGITAVGNQNTSIPNRIFRGVNVSNNNVALGADRTIGINIEDNTNGTASCNQVSNLTGQGGWQPGTIGLISNGNDLLSYDCNYQGQVEYALALVGQNTNASYQRFGFNGSLWGLTVGFQASSRTDDEIGENPLFPAFEFQPGVQIHTAHFADPSKYGVNSITERAGPSLYTPTTGDFNNWFTLIPNINPPVAPCGGCLGITPPWPGLGGCPPSVSTLDSEWTKLYKTRMLAKGIAVQANDCPPVATNCYTPLAEIEAEIESVLAQLQQDLEAATSLAESAEEKGEGGFTTAELEDLVDAKSELDVEGSTYEDMVEDLLPIKASLIKVPTCSPEGEIWKTTLDLQIKSYLEEGLSSLDNETLLTIANGCSTTDGPGVYVARKTIGVSGNDAAACISSSEKSENLVLKLDRSAEDLIFPNPAQSGQIVKVPVVGIISASLIGTDGIEMAASLSVNQQDVQLPEGLVEGLHVLTVMTVQGSNSFKLLIVK